MGSDPAGRGSLLGLHSTSVYGVSRHPPVKHKNNIKVDQITEEHNELFVLVTHTNVTKCIDWVFFSTGLYAGPSN